MGTYLGNTSRLCKKKGFITARRTWFLSDIETLASTYVALYETHCEVQTPNQELRATFKALLLALVQDEMLVESSMQVIDEQGGTLEQEDTEDFTNFVTRAFARNFR